MHLKSLSQVQPHVSGCNSVEIKKPDYNCVKSIGLTYPSKQGRIKSFYSTVFFHLLSPNI